MVISNVNPTALSFRASNVTGTRLLDLQVDRATPANRVAGEIAEMMKLPDDVSWVLRSDRSAAFLDESRPIGDQLTPGAQVTLAPRTHLG